MALTVLSLKGKIQAAMVAEFGPADDASKLAKFANAMATAIVSEITTNAVVPSGIAVATPDTLVGTTTAPGTVT